MSNTAFLCGPEIVEYKDFHFQSSAPNAYGTGCPIWPLKANGEPYERLSKPMKSALDELLEDWRRRRAARSLWPS